MAMKKCKECGEEISSSAKKCPKCGKDQRNFFMKHPVIYTILILVIVAAVSSGGSEENNNSKTTLSEGANSSEIVETNNAAETKISFNVGEIFENDYIAVKYVSLDDDFKDYNPYADVKSGYKIIKAEFEFENVSETDQLASDYDFNCYADGYDCEKFYSVDDYYGFSSNLSAGKKAKGIIYYEVPADASEITIEYEADWWTSQKVEFLVK